jgi:hypothetical protein
MIVIDASAMIAMLFGESHSTCRKGGATCGTSQAEFTRAKPPFRARTPLRGPARFLGRSLESVVVFYAGVCRQVCHRLRLPSKKTHKIALWKIVRTPLARCAKGVSGEIGWNQPRETSFQLNAILSAIRRGDAHLDIQILVLLAAHLHLQYPLRE